MRRLALVVGGASAVASAIYTIVYLYRWEWHRALVAAIFLVVAEVALATVAILRRLTALEKRLETGNAALPPTSPPANDVLARLRESAPPPRPVFAWLNPNGTNVFLPILLGAGVLASAVAWLVETVARATARPALEHRLAGRLDALALPAGGLLRPAPVAVAVAAPRRRVPPMLWQVPFILLVVCGLGLGIDELADATQSRPHHPQTGVTTVIELSLHGQLAAAIPERVVTSLWQSCTGTLQRDLPAPIVTALDGSHYRLEVPADLGVSTSRRVHGCLEDAAVDQVQAGVVKLSSTPAG